jgi:hypothetical protein
MSYQASIHHLITGRFLMQCSVEGQDLHAQCLIEKDTERGETGVAG